MALHDVPAETVSGAQRQLEIDPRAGLQRAERRARAASRRIASAAKLSPSTRDRRQADAVDGDRVALVELRSQARRDLDRRTAIVARDRAQRAAIGDQPCEHRTPVFVKYQSQP